jgi:hypothetical protein
MRCIIKRFPGRPPRYQRPARLRPPVLPVETPCAWTGRSGPDVGQDRAHQSGRSLNPANHVARDGDQSHQRPPLGCRVCVWSRCWLLTGRTPRANLGRTRPGSPHGPDNRAQAAVHTIEPDGRYLHRVAWQIGLNGPLSRPFPGCAAHRQGCRLWLLFAEARTGRRSCAYFFS